MTLTIGQQAPTFELQATQSEEAISLSSLRGRYVVLFFYPKDDTPGCTKEACSFRDHYADIKGLQDTVVLGISADDVESHQNFAQKHELPFPLLADVDHAVAEAYGTWQEKKFLGKTVWGINRTTFLINPEGQVVHIFENVKPETHVQEVIAVLGELQAN